MDRADITAAGGTVGGLLAYLLGYLVVYLAQGSSVRETLSTINALIEFVGGGAIPVWKAIGWIFYNAHAVPLQAPALGPGTASRSLIGSGGAPSLLYVVPPLVLLVLGGLLAVSADSPDVGSGAVAGGSIAIGYFLLAVVGTFLFRYPIQDAFVGPAVAMALVLAGIVYPVVFGAIGGGVAAALR